MTPRPRRKLESTPRTASPAGGPLRRARLADQLVDQLGQAIVDDVPVPSLSSEAALALQHGVSRTVVREAVQRLIACGMVQQRPKIGISVVPRTEWRYDRPEIIGWLARSPRKSEFLHHLTDLRMVLEPAIAERAAERATAAHRAAIDRADALLREATRGLDIELFLEADAAWHEAVTEACRNPVLIDTMRRHRAAIALSRSTTVRGVEIERIRRRFLKVPSARREELAETAYSMHHAVTLAIREGKGPEARRAMVDLIGGVDTALFEVLGS